MFMEKKLSHQRSKNNVREAKKVLPDGGSRSTISLAPHSIYAQSASGKYLQDIDGNKYFDSFSALLENSFANNIN